jgi:hypothetical protein
LALFYALEELQVVDKQDFTGLNGEHRHTDGLQGHCGSRFRVEYISGEQIHAYDNACLVFCRKDIIALHDFFRDLAQDARKPFFKQEDIEKKSRFDGKNFL